MKKLFYFLFLAVQVADPGDIYTIKPNLCFQDSFEMNLHKDTVVLFVAKGDIVSISFKSHGNKPELMIDGGNGDKRPYAVHCDKSFDECVLLFVYPYHKAIYKQLVVLEMNGLTSVSYRLSLKEVSEKSKKEEESECTEAQRKEIVGDNPTAECFVSNGVPSKRCKPGYRGKNCELDDVAQRLKRVAEEEDIKNSLQIITCGKEYRLVNAKTSTMTFSDTTIVAAAPTPSGSHSHKGVTEEKGNFFWKLALQVEIFIVYSLVFVVILLVAHRFCLWLIECVQNARKFRFWLWLIERLQNVRRFIKQPNDVEMDTLNTETPQV